MLIRCPKCETGFNLPEEKIPEKGAKVKCSACTHTFRVRIEDGAPVFFSKDAEAVSSTTVGRPGLADKFAPGAKSAEDDDADGGTTQFGLAQRSKSAREGYNPFPLARATSEQKAIPRGEFPEIEEARNDSTQLFGSHSEAFADEAPEGLVEESAGNQTAIGAPLRERTPPLHEQVGIAVDDEVDISGNTTRAFGSGGLDLFDGAAPEQTGTIPLDFDPFGDAFESPVGDVGLLMPSTPMTDEPVSSPGLSLEQSSEVGISEEDFLRGGGSDFGEAMSLVDNSFGEDVPAFDASEGVVDVEKRSKPRRPGTGQTLSLAARNDEHEELELEDIRTDERPRRTRTPAPRREEPAPRREEPAPRREEPAPEPVRAAPVRPLAAAPAYVHDLGASSPVRRTFDVIFIGLVVAVAFVGFISARVGGFMDFARFGHMLEVAFSGEEFVPREEWKQVVQLPPPDPPPEEPLRIENLRAFERTVGDAPVLILSGRIRNYSYESFKGVKVRATVQQGDKALIEEVHDAGQTLDRKKLGEAKSVADINAALKSKLPDIGTQGTTYFVIVLDKVPAAVLKTGNYDYSVVIAD